VPANVLTDHQWRAILLKQPGGVHAADCSAQGLRALHGLWQGEERRSVDVHLRSHRAERQARTSQVDGAAPGAHQAGDLQARVRGDPVRVGGHLHPVAGLVTGEGFAAVRQGRPAIVDAQHVLIRAHQPLAQAKADGQFLLHAWQAHQNGRGVAIQHQR